MEFGHNPKRECTAYQLLMRDRQDDRLLEESVTRHVVVAWTAVSVPRVLGETSSLKCLAVTHHFVVEPRNDAFSAATDNFLPCFRILSEDLPPTQEAPMRISAPRPQFPTLSLLRGQQFDFDGVRFTSTAQPAPAWTPVVWPARVLSAQPFDTAVSLQGGDSGAKCLLRFTSHSTAFDASRAAEEKLVIVQLFGAFDSDRHRWTRCPFTVTLFSAVAADSEPTPDDDGNGMSDSRQRATAAFFRMVSGMFGTDSERTERDFTTEPDWTSARHCLTSSEVCLTASDSTLPLEPVSLEAPEHRLQCNNNNDKY